jgi:hypothetical protein
MAVQQVCKFSSIQQVGEDSRYHKRAPIMLYGIVDKTEERATRCRASLSKPPPFSPSRGTRKLHLVLLERLILFAWSFKWLPVVGDIFHPIDNG